MRMIIIAALLSLTLAGCATTAPYGNYLGQSAGVDQTQLATEAVDQLVTLYPPARSRFELQQPTPDTFGLALVRGLRDKGYAVLEYQQPAAPAATTATTASQEVEAAEPVVNVPNQAQTYPLRYVVDEAADLNLYRLTLLVGNQSLTRPYVSQNGELLPAGYWVRKE